MGELIGWLVYDIWSQDAVVADPLNQDADSVSEAGEEDPRTCLDDPPNLSTSAVGIAPLAAGEIERWQWGKRKWVFPQVYHLFSAETALY